MQKESVSERMGVKIREGSQNEGVEEECMQNTCEGRKQG